MRWVFLGIVIITLLLPEEFPPYDEIIDENTTTTTTTSNTFSEAQTWSTFAKWVEDSDIIEIPDTDFVVRMATRLKQRGVLKDISRLDRFASENSVMNGDTKDKILQALRKGENE